MKKQSSFTPLFAPIMLMLLYGSPAQATNNVCAGGGAVVVSASTAGQCLWGNVPALTSLTVDGGVTLGPGDSVSPFGGTVGTDAALFAFSSLNPSNNPIVIGSITNNGTIEGGNQAAFLFSDADGISVTLAGDIVNNGIIQATKDGFSQPRGVFTLVNVNFSGGNIVNNGTIANLPSAAFPPPSSLSNTFFIASASEDTQVNLINNGVIQQDRASGGAAIRVERFGAGAAVLNLDNGGLINTSAAVSPGIRVLAGAILNLSGSSGAIGANGTSSILLTGTSTLNLSGTPGIALGVDGGANGTLNINGDATSQSGFTNFANATVLDSVIFNLGDNLGSTNVTVGQGASGVLNQSAGTLTTTNFTVAAGGSYIQTGTGVLNATGISIGAGGSVTLTNQGTGSIDGAAAGQGALIFAGSYNTDAALGGTNALDSISINDGANLVLDQIAAANSLTIGGGTSGNLILGAANLIDDNTAVTVNAGATVNLQGNNETIGSLAGAGNTGLAGAALTTGGNNSSTSYSGVLSGPGSLTKQGAGTFTLSGANTYAGGTTVSAGILQGTTTSLQGNITNNATVTFDQTTTGTYAGDISGTGNLIKSNTGTVVLSGTNTYSGGTTISGGTLTLQGGAALADNGAINITGGTLDIDNAETIGALSGGGMVNLDAALTTGDATNTTYSGVIQGGSSLIKQGIGTMNLSGTNTYTGGTTINGGILQGTTTSLQGGIINNANVTFDQTTSGTYAGVMSGTGSFIKSNTGSVNLTGINTYNGTTTINGGTLFVNGSIANSTTTVNAGGTLGGAGTVGSVFINGGIFAPGNSISTTNVTGNVDFSGGGNYNVEVNAAGASDLINATGSATLTSGMVNVQPEAGSYAQSTDYTILTAAGGLGGTTFASVNSSLAFLTPTLSYNANNVFLNLALNGTTLNSIANTPNQRAVSTVLANNVVSLQSIVNNVLVLTTTGAQQAYDSLSGVQHTQSQLLTQRLGQQFQQLLFNRGSQSSNTQFALNTQQNFNPMQGILLADNSNNWQNLASADTATSQHSAITPERGWWLQGFGGFGDIDDTANASGADYDTQGLVFGIDTEWRDFVIGVAGGYARSNANTFGGNLDIDSYQLAAYGSWEKEAVYTKASLGFGVHQTDASRAVVVGATISTATADYDSYNISAAVETGKDIALSQVTTLTPFVGVEYTRSNRDDFTETGAGVANLSVNDEGQDSLRSRLGLRLSHDITTKKGSHITPALSIAYVREHMDNVSRLDAAFTAVPTTAFQIDGSELDRDRLQIGLGVAGQINETTTLNIGYNGELAGSDEDHRFSATIRFIW